MGNLRQEIRKIIKEEISKAPLPLSHVHAVRERLQKLLSGKRFNGWNLRDVNTKSGEFVFTHPIYNVMVVATPLKYGEHKVDAKVYTNDGTKTPLNLLNKIVLKDTNIYPNGDVYYDSEACKIVLWKVLNRVNSML